jgi:hypothetical protein
MPDNDVAVIKTGSPPTVGSYYSAVGTINLGLAVNPTTGELFVPNTDALNLISFQPNLRGHWINSRISRIQVATGTITPFDLNPNLDYNILPNPQALSTALSQPAGVVFDPAEHSCMWRRSELTEWPRWTLMEMCLASLRYLSPAAPGPMWISKTSGDRAGWHSMRATTRCIV